MPKNKKPYFYYRCTGLGTHRWGGVRVCSSRQVRADALEQAVWQDACQILENPVRLQREWERRLQDCEPNSSLSHENGRRLLVQAEQGLQRLIDGFQEGLLTKSEFAARSAAVRRRMESLEAEMTAHLSVDQTRQVLEEHRNQWDQFTAVIATQLETADLATRIRILRLMIKSITVSDETIQIQYQVPQLPFDLSPARGIAQDHSQRIRRLAKAPRTGDV